MIYALKERIGDPSLFCGRKRQMELLMNWADMIPRQMSKSRVLLGRRKSGKTAIMQRLFNILWNQNGKVIPLYFEIQDAEQKVSTRRLRHGCMNRAYFGAVLLRNRSLNISPWRTQNPNDSYFFRQSLG
ncbi:MAG: ATP-binding protein [Gammaproteobacteria bacterium]|nr:ATP-binding protein [Gammaproteobacteria bacterium]